MIYQTWPAELDAFAAHFVRDTQKPVDRVFVTARGPGKRISGGSPYPVLRATLELDGEQKKALDRFTGEAAGTPFWSPALEEEGRSLVCFNEMPVARESLYQSGQERHLMEIRLRVLQEGQDVRGVAAEVAFNRPHPQDVGNGDETTVTDPGGIALGERVAIALLQEQAITYNEERRIPGTTPRRSRSISSRSSTSVAAGSG